MTQAPPEFSVGNGLAPRQLLTGFLHGLALLLGFRLIIPGGGQQRPVYRVSHVSQVGQKARSGYQFGLREFFDELMQGRFVGNDRFSPSTAAFRRIGGGLSMKACRSLSFTRQSFPILTPFNRPALIQSEMV
jgi:hypothetical protein